MSTFNIINGNVFSNGVNTAIAAKWGETYPESELLAGFDNMHELHVTIPVSAPAEKLKPDTPAGAALCHLVRAAKSDHRLRGVSIRLFEQALKPGYICDNKVEIILGLFAMEDQIEIIDLIKNSLSDAEFGGSLIIKNPYPCITKAMRNAGIKSHVLRMAPKRSARSVYRVRTVSRSAAAVPKLSRTSLRGLFQESE